MLYELYDYQEDLLETVNIASTHIDVLEKMKSLLDREPPVMASARKRIKPPQATAEHSER